MYRSRPAVIMGYSGLQKGYILLDLTDKSFFTCRDVVFREDLFPFAKMDHLIQERVFVNPMHVSDMLSDDLQCTSSRFPDVLLLMCLMRLLLCLLLMR